MDAHSIPATSGIYRIVCTVTGKFYIGSAVNLQKRRNGHFHELRHNIHKNPKLQRAWNKYGPDAFTFEILELILLPELLTAREQYWFAKLKPFGNRGFNIAPTAGSNLGKEISPETRMKLSKSSQNMSAETKEKIGLARLGRTMSTETRAKIGDANRGRPMSETTRQKLAETNKGRKASEETKRKMSEARKGKTPSAESIEKSRLARLGQKRSTEARARMSAAQLGNTSALGHTCSPEAREKMRLAALKRIHKTG